MKEENEKKDEKIVKKEAMNSDNEKFWTTSEEESKAKTSRETETKNQP